MAAARELAAGQNWSDLDHGRAREVGEKKEEREGVRFHALPTAEEHQGNRILRRKSGAGGLLWWWCSCSSVLAAGTCPCGGGLQGGASGARAAQGTRETGTGPGRGGGDARAAGSVPGGVLVVHIEIGGRRTGTWAPGGWAKPVRKGGYGCRIGHQGATQRQGHGALVAGDRRVRLQQQAHEQQESGATATASVHGCEGGGRAGARGKSRADYVGSRDAMQRLGLRENL
jgi:hypothetical protein